MNERLEDIIENRKRKLDEIKAAGIDPYPSSNKRTHSNKQARTPKSRNYFSW
jgi:lysyl-tRNA synthetase class II